jgi:predicted DNA-binding transcriptional regulator AlpA
MDGRCLSQNELAKRWQVSESTLERWRAERIGPSFLKLGGQVRYRLMDIMAFEDQTLQVMAHQKPALDYPKQQLRQPHRSL